MTTREQTGARIIKLFHEWADHCQESHEDFFNKFFTDPDDAARDFALFLKTYDWPNKQPLQVPRTLPITHPVR